MDYVTPKEVAGTMLSAALTKSSLATKDLLIRGMLSGALLAISVTIAFTAVNQTSMPLMGAIVFPVGFIVIILLGLELVTGSFAIIPIAYMEKQISAKKMLNNLFWVFIGNLIGSLLYAILYWAAITTLGANDSSDPIAQMIIKASEKKTIGYMSFGSAGAMTMFIKAILCNWMVCMGVVMSMTSKSTIGKVIAAGMPIFMFFSLGFEHAVVNMFLIPAGILFGANVSIADWWYNQSIVTLGNIVGGLLFTGLAVFYTFNIKAKNTEVELQKAS
ncbi:MAG TPA: formate/nitrite transporter family protein [Chitinophagales bacterium]|nr:formate/nitrite transporter family protein [Chitinophagales bacterium]HMW13218.1 formate/nitrite transporter family protein [Chitinophagales bacterium]HMX60920.1 formate/nitrite transporter family protein [Chitinophagales bacterium]HMY24665.1 formate/nitrite transporter family protein [Chitinophagales bacterium]HMZ34047.1 formate/nitrite transporter family protein [Chitinophagales bacterium]